MWLISKVAGIVTRHTGVPCPMQIAGVLPALISTELSDLNIISASGIPDCMKGLVHVTDKVDKELQRFHPIRP
jgi:hypothetical protein